MIHDLRVPALFMLVVLLFPAGRAAGAGPNDSRDLHLVGDARMIGNRVRLTDRYQYMTGAVWRDEQVPVASGFMSQFSFSITEPGGLHNQAEGTDGADGLAFVIQNESVDAIGDTGEDVGYGGGGGIRNSIAIELDTWMNSGPSPPEFHDPNGYHISIHTRGTLANSADEYYSLGCASYPSLAYPGDHTAVVSYDTAMLRVYIDDLMNPILSIPIDISDVLDLNEGCAWLGFTASTGAAWENHDIFDWWVGGPPTPTTDRTWGGIKAIYR